MTGIADEGISPAADVSDQPSQVDPDATGPEAEVPSEAEIATLSTRAERTAADRAKARELFVRLAGLPEDHPERARLRDDLVEAHLPLVEYLARRFRNRGEPLDDLIQVATIGLIKSVDRFDLDRGVEFSTYATPTIVGEIKRHFRDKGWAIRVPRRLQELKLSLTKATSELSQKNGRSPTVAELAAHLQMTEEEILEGLESANAYSAVSLDAPDGGDDDSPAVADTLGISQMHVSRLLARTLAQLREGLLVEE